MRLRPEMVGPLVALLLFTSHASGQRVSIKGSVRLAGMPAANAVVYLVSASQHGRSGHDTLSIDQESLRFMPQVLAVHPGSTVVFGNSDPLMHNVFSPERLGAAFNLGTYAKGETRAYTFNEEGAHVILCHVHPEMAAYVVVVRSFLKAVTDARGEFVISNVPPGNYTLKTWHRRAREFATTITVDAQPAPISLTLRP